MKRDKERARSALRGASVPATVGFIALTLALLVLAVQLIAGAAARTRAGEREKERTAAATAQPDEIALPDQPTLAEEPVSEAAAVLSPESAASLPGETPLASAAQTPSPQETPSANGETPSADGILSPSAPRETAQGVFREKRMDLFLPVFGEDGALLYLVLLATRENTATFLFAPGNLLCADGLPLSARRSAYSAREAFAGVFPVRYPYYVSIDAHKTAACVDAVGGITIAGKALAGSEVQKLITEDGSDELLRIEKLQSVIAAYLAAVQEAGILRLIGSKSALTAGTQGNLSATQYLALYQAVKRVNVPDITWRILPVDSVILEQTRYYRADAALCAELAGALYGG